MKRFWKSAAPVGEAGDWRIELDGRPVRTPARALLTVRQQALAQAIATEWELAGKTVDPRAMPMTGLANAALDRIAPYSETFAAGLAKYGEGDLLTYRADTPHGLVERQRALWDPLLNWARRRYDVDFTVTRGVRFVPQAPATVERLAHAVRSLEPFTLAGLAPLVTIGGSLVAALAVHEHAAAPEDAWTAVTVDEAWQMENWGHDPEAATTLENRRRDFMNGARFLSLIRN